MALHFAFHDGGNVPIMIPMMTPPDAGLMNVVLCLAGSVLFSIGLGATGNLILKKRDIL